MITFPIAKINLGLNVVEKAISRLIVMSNGI